MSAIPEPRQLALDAFCDHLQTTRDTDDALLQAALRRLFIRDDFTGMTRKTQEVLIALMARRSFARPTEIHVSAWDQSFIADASGASRSTVKRAYALFEMLGWLERDAQDYDVRRKRYGHARLAFTPAFVAMTGLDRSFESAASEISLRAPCSQNKPTVVQNEPHIYVHSEEQLLKKKQPAAAPRTKVNAVPPELRILMDRGLNNWTVFWLMRLASQAGKRLSDLVEVLRGAVEERSGARLKGFLRLKISDGVDYAWRLRQLREKASEQAALTGAERSLEDLVGQWVDIDGVAEPVRITRLGSGFFGQGMRGSLPHGQLVAVMRAGGVRACADPRPAPISPETVSGGPAKDVSSQAKMHAMATMRALLGKRHAYCG